MDAVEKKTVSRNINFVVVVFSSLLELFFLLRGHCKVYECVSVSISLSSVTTAQCFFVRIGYSFLLHRDIVVARTRTTTRRSNYCCSISSGFVCVCLEATKICC